MRAVRLLTGPAAGTVIVMPLHHMRRLVELGQAEPVDELPVELETVPPQVEVAETAPAPETAEAPGADAAARRGGRRGGKR